MFLLLGNRAADSTCACSPICDTAGCSTDARCACPTGQQCAAGLGTPQCNDQDVTGRGCCPDCNTCPPNTFCAASTCGATGCDGGACTPSQPAAPPAEQAQIVFLDAENNVLANGVTINFDDVEGPRPLPQEKSFMVCNTGNANLNPQLATAAPAGYEVVNLPSVVQPASCASFQIRFFPESGAYSNPPDVDYDVTISIQSNTEAPNNVFRFEAMANYLDANVLLQLFFVNNDGEALVPSGTGEADAGATIAGGILTGTLNLRNNGDKPVSIKKISLAGASQFKITSPEDPNAAISLPEGQSVGITFSFTSSASDTAQDYTSVLTIEFSTSGVGDYTATLKATVISGKCEFVFEFNAEPSLAVPIDNGDVIDGRSQPSTRAANYQFTARNQGDATCTGLGSLTAVNGSVSGASPSSLAPGTSTQWSVLVSSLNRADVITIVTYDSRTFTLMTHFTSPGSDTPNGYGMIMIAGAGAPFSPAADGSTSDTTIYDTYDGWTMAIVNGGASPLTINNIDLTSNDKKRSHTSISCAEVEWMSGCTACGCILPPNGVAQGRVMLTLLGTESPLDFSLAIKTDSGVDPDYHSSFTATRMVTNPTGFSERPEPFYFVEADGPDFGQINNGATIDLNTWTGFSTSVGQPIVQRIAIQLPDNSGGNAPSDSFCIKLTDLSIEGDGGALGATGFTPDNPCLGSSSFFYVVLTANKAGLSQFVVSFKTNDPSQPDFSFTVQGLVVNAADVTAGFAVFTYPEGSSDQANRLDNNGLVDYGSSPLGTSKGVAYLLRNVGTADVRISPPPVVSSGFELSDYPNNGVSVC